MAKTVMREKLLTYIDRAELLRKRLLTQQKQKQKQKQQELQQQWQRRESSSFSDTCVARRGGVGIRRARGQARRAGRTSTSITSFFVSKTPPSETNFLRFHTPYSRPLSCSSSTRRLS